MVEVFAGILGGVGLLFFGMWMLSENLKALVGPRLRMLASRLADNRFAAFGWGSLAGAITQSSPAVTFITVSMVRSGLISARQGYPIALGAQLGVGLILLIVTLDIRLVALCGLGVGSIVITRARRGNYRATGAMLFGIAALLFGLALIKESAAPLADQPWFRAALDISTRSILLSFVLGALLTFMVQALVPVVAFGIGLAAANLVGVEQVLMYIYGSYVGLGISVVVVSANLRGTARQIGMFWAGQCFFSAAILVPLLYVEVYLGVPLVKAAVTALDIGLGPQMAIAVIIFGMPKIRYVPHLTYSTVGVETRQLVLQPASSCCPLRSGPCDCSPVSGRPATKNSSPRPGTSTTGPLTTLTRPWTWCTWSRPGCSGPSRITWTEPVWERPWARSATPPGKSTLGSTSFWVSCPVSTPASAANAIAPC